MTLKGSRSCWVIYLVAYVMTSNQSDGSPTAEFGSGAGGGGNLPGDPTDNPVERRCSLEAGGTLTLFNGERTEVRVPCKYRLADFTCGDYRVKVTPGSSVDAEARYFHDTAWVKVVNTVTMETVKLRTSLRLLERAEAGMVDNPWQIKEGDTDFLDFAGYDGGIARLEQDGAFTVQFSNSSVTVTCAAPDFASLGVPETLCGDGSTEYEVRTARLAMLGDADLDEEQFVEYIILNDTTVTQSEQCVALANLFQQCSWRERTVSACHKYFSDQNVTQCLIGIGTPLQVAYDYCTRWSCFAGETNVPELGDC